MKNIYSKYPLLVNNKRIPTDYCIVCYKSDNECNCNVKNIKSKLERLNEELKGKIGLWSK